MIMDAVSISRYKNNLCIANFLLCLIFIFFGYTDVNFNIKSFLGFLGVTLGPIVWNGWLYDGLFENSDTRPITLRAFLWIGLLMALAVSIALLSSFYRGTL